MPAPSSQGNFTNRKLRHGTGRWAKSPYGARSKPVWPIAREAYFVGQRVKLTQMGVFALEWRYPTRNMPKVLTGRIASFPRPRYGSKLLRHANIVIDGRNRLELMHISMWEAA